MEAAIIGVLSKRCPDHGVLGEEGLAGTGDRGDDLVWILDPIDGTTNFVHEGVNYCVSIACYQGDQGVAAIIYDPTREETFAAARGHGAWLNDRPMRVAPSRSAPLRHGGRRPAGAAGGRARHAPVRTAPAAPRRGLHSGQQRPGPR